MHRSELAALELREARQHGFRTAVMIGVSVALVLVGGMAATLAVAAAVWNRDDRGLILSLVAVGYLAVSAAFALVAARRLKTWQPFAETSRQLHADCACIQDIISSAKR